MLPFEQNSLISLMAEEPYTSLVDHGEWNVRLIINNVKANKIGFHDAFGPLTLTKYFVLHHSDRLLL